MLPASPQVSKLRSGSLTAGAGPVDRLCDEAYHWLCRSRAEAGANHDVWILRHQWSSVRPRLLASLGAGSHRLSSQMGALYLSGLDQRLEDLPGIHFARFQDDVVILAESRWKLRRAIRVLNQEFAGLSVEQHPDKTFVGKIERGFDFLGHHFALEPPEKENSGHTKNNKST